MLIVVTGMPNARSCSCMAGRVSGPAGNIRSKRSRYDYLFLSLEYMPFSHRCLQEDYRVIAPSLRGFGGSTHPGDVQSSGTVFDAVGDLLCILKHANVEQAVVIGQVGSPV
jgi:pimeloyl-ACP methyl ester carboxylesterase